MPAAPPATLPDLRRGVAWSQLAPNVPYPGQVDGQEVLLVRQGETAFAVGARCTHYGGPLAQGRVVQDGIRCPWHHACFRLKDGKVLRAPALAPVAHYAVHRAEGQVRVTPTRPQVPKKTTAGPKSVSIVGAGAAGYAAVCTLREEGYGGSITVIGREPHLPYDRVKLSKGYLAGAVHDDALMLMPPPEGFDHAVVWQRGRSAVALDLAHKHLSLDDGSVHPYDALLIATGAAPNVLPIAGANLPHVFVLRSLADTHAIRQQAAACRHAVILGAGFIGLEAAAALRQQNIEVTVVSRDKAPMAALLGDALSGHVCARHTVRGVRFVLEAQAEQITPNAVVLRGGQKLDADLVIMGAGVTPDVAWVQKAGLATDVGILVDPNQRTSSRDIYAAGDVAQVRHSAASAGERFEHWAVAERMGQTAARSMLGLPQPAPAMPFFWSEHYDLKLRYVGHAAPLERAEVYGSLAQDKVAVALYSQGRIAAVATIGHDPLSLACEQALEAGDTARLGQLLHQA